MQSVWLQTTSCLLPLNSLTNLVVEFPQAAGAHGYLAWYLSETRRHDEAIVHSRQAINLAPTSRKASLVHFHVLSRNNQLIDALDEMKRFLILRPSEEYASMIAGWQLDNDTRD